jgi:hypothetical protein
MTDEPTMLVPIEQDKPNPSGDVRYILSKHEQQLMEFARQQQDASFIQNYQLIREKFIIYLSNPATNQHTIPYNKLAEEWGCKPDSLKRLKKSPAFMGIVATVMREYMLQFAGGEILTMAFEQLKRHVGKGDRWAVEAALRIGGVLKSKEGAKADDDAYSRAVEQAAKGD